MKRRLDEKRRGFTLTELAVVLAVMAIVTALSLTFSSLLSERSKEGEALLEAMNDIAVAESAIESWLNKNTEIEIESGAALKSTDGTRSVKIEGGKLFVNENAIYTFERVTDMTFAKQEQNENTIYFCSVAYTLPKQAEKENYTFSVYKQTVTP